MKRLFLFAVFLALPFSSTANALTLQDALQSGRENSHELKALQFKNESLHLEETKKRAGYLPKLDVHGRHLLDERFEELEVPFNGETFVMPAIQPYSRLGATATVNLFKGGETRNELKAAKYARTAGERRLQYAEERLRTGIRTLFYRALGSQILVRVAEKTIETLQSHLNDVRARVRSGVSTRYDVLRTEVQLEEAETAKIAAENNVAIARAKLFAAIGRTDDGRPLQGELPEDFGRIDVARLDPQRSERAALIAERDETLYLAQAAESHWWPEVSLFGDYEWYNNFNASLVGDDERFKSAYALGLQFSWNLYDGGASLAEQRQAALDRRIAEEKLAGFDQHAPAELEEAKRRFYYNVMNFRTKLSSIKKAEEALRLARGGVRAGTRTSTDVLDAVVDLNRAKAAAVTSQIDAIEALGQLELSIGHTL